MIVRYSTCHFAEAMEQWKQAKTLGAKREYYYVCSFCNKVCELIPPPFTVQHDIELTLRRWKDGDCSLDDMFERLNKEYRRAWNEVFEIAQKRLQKGKKPKFEFDVTTLGWKDKDGNITPYLT